MLSPADFEACVARCHRGTLVRQVGEEQARAAPTAGLVPAGADVTAASHSSYLAPRPGCLYLARPGGRARSSDPWVVAIDMRRLDPDRFVVDEGAYFSQLMWGSSRPYLPLAPPDGELPASVVSRIGCNTSLDNGRPTAGEWIDSISADLDTSDQVRRCFEDTDVIAYAGA
ncbi:hypothetical protein AB0L40_26070, partial [Patulibacter sp. NPDC049589]|uniref:hypothetical protein n=1 Tax=Patulibacter sp. NPDC049589 TaxID=3154731 RepID=UPI003432CE50